MLIYKKVNSSCQQLIHVLCFLLLINPDTYLENNVDQWS